MSRLSGVAADVSLGGVRYLALGEVGRVFRGKRFVKADMQAAGVPCIHYGEIYTKYGTSADTSFSYVSQECARTLRFAQPGDVVMASAGETIDDIGKSVAWLGNEPVAIHDACYAFSSDMDPKFVAYYFNSRSFRQQLRQRISSSKVSSISTRAVEAMRIPVPPADVQRSIVRTLDQFSQLEAELKAELEAEVTDRRQQYRFHRDALFTFPVEVPRVPLADLGSIFGGLTGKSKSDFSNGNARFASYKNVFRNKALDTGAADFVNVAQGERQRSLEYGDVIFTGSSESVEDVGMSSVVTKHLGAPMYLNSFCIGFRPNDLSQIDPEFSKHLFRAPMMRDQIVRTANGVTRINVSKVRLAKIDVPVPDGLRQRWIASVLDEFDSLIHDLNISLPAELAARRQQYEYYRDKLLTFEEAPA